MEEIIKANYYDSKLIKIIDDKCFDKIFHEDFEYYYDCFDKGYDSYIVIVDNLPAGEFIIRYENKETMAIESFAILPNFRGRKLSEKMLAYIDNIGKDFKKIMLEVYTENKRAIDIYQKNGYNITSILEDFYAYGYNAYVMEKPMEKNFKEKVKLHNIQHIVNKVGDPKDIVDDLSFEEVWMDKVDQIMFDEERERHKKKVR